MAENSVIISAEEEAKLLKPIDEYVEKIQKKIDALRVDGSDKVNDLKNQIAIAKENKNLSKAQRPQGAGCQTGGGSREARRIGRSDRPCGAAGTPETGGINPEELGHNGKEVKSKEEKSHGKRRIQTGRGGTAGRQSVFRAGVLHRTGGTDGER